MDARWLQDHADLVGSGEFASLLGVATDDPNGYMKTKGLAMGREIMSKLMQSIYADDGMQQPADAVGAPYACSVNYYWSGLHFVPAAC